MGNGTSAVNKGVLSSSMGCWGKGERPLEHQPNKNAIHSCEKGTKDAPDQFLELIIMGHPTTLVTIFVNSTLD